MTIGWANAWFEPLGYGGWETEEFLWHFEDWEPDADIIVAMPFSVPEPYEAAGPASTLVRFWQMEALLGAVTMNRYGDRIVAPGQIVSAMGSSELLVDASRPAKREPYPPAAGAAVDGDPFATVWITGEEEGEGVGATLDLVLDATRLIDGIGIVPGHQLRENFLYYARPSRIEVIVDGEVLHPSRRRRRRASRRSASTSPASSRA